MWLYSQICCSSSQTWYWLRCWSLTHCPFSSGATRPNWIYGELSWQNQKEGLNLQHREVARPLTLLLCCQEKMSNMYNMPYMKYMHIIFTICKICNIRQYTWFCVLSSRISLWREARCPRHPQQELKLLWPLQADRRRPGTNGLAWARRPGRRRPSGPAVEWAAVRRSGLALLLPAAAAAERKGARGMGRGPEVRGRAGRGAGSRMIWHPRAELKCAGRRGEGKKLCARDGPRPWGAWACMEGGQRRGWYGNRGPSWSALACGSRES